MPSIFLAGATGFIGGTILASLCKAHPELHIKALIRRQSDAENLQSVYPSLEPIIGDLSSLDLLRETAASVDFVIYGAKEDIPAVHALIDGLASSFAADPPSPRIISISGTRSLIDLSLLVTGIVKEDARPWSDIKGIRAIRSLPKERFHAEADQSIIAHASASGVGAMLVAPGQLWGRGKGQVKTEGAAATAYYAAGNNRGRAFVVGDGSVAWSWSSIGDLGNAVVFLMDQAMASDNAKQQRVRVNGEGYYFVQTDDVRMKDRAEAISGRSATFRADRLRALGWRPKELDWRVLMEEEGGQRA